MSVEKLNFLVQQYLPIVLLLLGAMLVILLAFTKSSIPKAGGRGRKFSSETLNVPWLIVSSIGVGLVASIFVQIVQGILAFSIGAGLLASSLVYPVMSTNRYKKDRANSRREAITIGSSVSGTLQNGMSLTRSLGMVVTNNTEAGGRLIPLTSPFLERAVLSVNTGRPLDVALAEAAESMMEDKYYEAAEMFLALAQAAEYSSGQDAMADLVDSAQRGVEISDRLSGELESDMAIATMSRYTLLGLVLFMIVYLVFVIEGNPLGRVLVETWGGRLLLLVSMIPVYVAQIIGSKMEQLPHFRF